MQKKGKTIPYEVAETFMLRAPLLTSSVIDDISGVDKLEEILRHYYSQSHISEALLLASPDLHQILEQWLNGKQPDRQEKFMFTLLKYLIRMSSRSTPFGMFAGVCSGSFSDETEIILDGTDKHQLHIRPDMQFLCTISNEILEDHDVRTKLKYYPNSSLYAHGDAYRYIEAFTDKEGIRKYRLQGTPINEELESVLSLAKEGTYIDVLCGVLSGNGIDKDDAIKYIHALIDNGVLVPELEPNLTGKPYFDTLLQALSNKGINHDLLKIMMEFEKQFKIAASDKSNRVPAYKSVIKLAAESGVPFKKSTLIQADMRLAAVKCAINKSVQKDIRNVLPVLMKLSRPNKGVGLLYRFKEAFQRRYESHEIPLTLALDAEAGPGYLPDDLNANASVLLEGLRLPSREMTEQEFDWSHIDSMLHRKLTDALITGESIVQIMDSDLEALELDPNEFPLSFSMMTRMFGPHPDISGKERIQIISAGGSSALNIAGRFCHLDEGLEKAMRNISMLEQDLSEDHLLAEIIHLPQQRTGNILMRPKLRDYEIPFLGQAVVNHEGRIPISDLMVSIRNDKVMIRSKRLNKYILPRLSNAHNYSMGSLAVYRFLCDLQVQGKRSGFGFSWGPLEDETRFLPRVEYKNFIFRAAEWRLFQEDIKSLKACSSDDELKQKMDSLRTKYKIPQKVLLSMFDHELWLDLDNRHCLALLRNELGKMQKLVLKEYLFDHDISRVKGNSGPLNNECVFFIHRKS